ncbi:hypothetical protein B0A48_05073 [Cryoendolithus antarcticus]|uniref:Probable kinetochore protein NUF2 n=1 Tax=Cryoendolithus antarcticus TaxID=1507870 RepID=A0A1V8TEI0_9PEZI|nr:hypothetical protein B0A48_05073 [Cryoendolithus antarcticus]
MPSMAHNPRMSMAGSSQQSSQQKQQKKEDDGDAFMTLSDKEIAGCISDIGIPFALSDLHKPNPLQIQKVFEWFAELLTNTTREIVAPAMCAAAESLYGEEADRIYTADTRELMGFFITLRRLLQECGIKDFTFSDLYRPTHPRLVKIFSYIINFIRFRESQTSVIDEHYNSSERTKNTIEVLYQANQEKQEQLEEMQQNRKNVEQALRDKEKRTGELRTRLLELKASQERVTDKLERVKSEQAKFKAMLEERTVAVMNTRQDANKLRPYTEQSPAVLELSLRDLQNNLNRDNSEISRLEKRSRALQTSSDSFATLHADITNLTRILSDLAVELAKEDEEAQKAGKNRDALVEQTNNVREVERQETMLRRQLASTQSKMQKLQADIDSKAAKSQERTNELKALYEELSLERREKGEEVEKRRIRIEQMEKKMADLKEQIEHEVQSAREEYMKMESHIRLYITEMEQSI